jgi:hypothetical protein
LYGFCDAVVKPDSFLLFDSECFFTATFFLDIFVIIRPEKVNLRFHALAYHLLNTMIGNGDMVVRIRKSELDYLSKLLYILQSKITWMN